MSRRFTEAEVAEVWERRRAGESTRSIARRLGRNGSSIRRLFEDAGGVCPAPRRRAVRHLSLAEREEISRGVAAGDSLRVIASRLGRAASTISRELTRNGGRRRYRAHRADQAAWQRARRPQRCKLAANPQLRQLVEDKLAVRWSPQQISGWLATTYPDQPEMQVSHETIYRSLFVQARGVLKKELQQYLRSQRAIRRSRHASLKRDGLGQISNVASIRERPASVEDRAVPGHWEGDLIAGSNNSYIATLVERHTRYVMLAKVKNKDTESVVSALIKQSKKLPDELYKSLTWDRGKEMADHQRFTLPPMLRYIFVTRRVPGSVALMKIPIAC